MRYTVLLVFLLSFLVTGCGTGLLPEKHIFVPCFDVPPQVQCLERVEPEGGVRREDDQGQIWIDVQHENLVRAWIDDEPPRLQCEEAVKIVLSAINQCIEQAGRVE